MSKYYNPKRNYNLFDPKSSFPFKLSRSKIDLFLECPRCFYLDRGLGISRPPGFPFNLNRAVDVLLKKEFDVHRIKKSRHPLMEEYGIEAVPFNHPQIDEWRDTRRGLQHLHQSTNLLITGALDDVWVTPGGELLVVDYKATSKDGEVSIDADWQISYKRQIETYQWLLRKNEFLVSNIGYFVYCNGDTDKKAFDKKIEFNVKVIPYEGNDDWVEGVIKEMHGCLNLDTVPPAGEDCDFCAYREAVGDVLR